jgi:hypothetical protein
MMSYLSMVTPEGSAGMPDDTGDVAAVRPTGKIAWCAALV